MQIGLRLNLAGYLTLEISPGYYISWDTIAREQRWRWNFLPVFGGDVRNHDCSRIKFRKEEGGPQTFQ